MITLEFTPSISLNGSNISRIKNRNRDCEREISSEYLLSLNISYEKDNVISSNINL